jgi:bifunctional non-homologous end joining protein LigD
MNAVSETLERVTLYHRKGSSDKIYQTAIEPAGNLFVVNYAHGRRGATLNTGTKTNVPVDYESAKRIFDQVVKEKKNHPKTPYTEGTDGTPYQNSDKQVSGILPQLLNPVDEAEIEALLHDDNYCAQEKHDGRHLLIRKQDEQLEGINKKGLVIGLPETVANEISTMAGNFILDGESIGDDYHVFDLLELNGENLQPLPYRERFSRLVDLLLLSDAEGKHIRLVQTVFKKVQKTELWERLRRENREGIVFKRLDAPYVPGKPNSAGPQLKFKFVATVSAVVAKINTQRSVEVSLLRGRSLVSCGNVTIPANHAIPQVGAVVEVRYLYAYPESLALYQPVYLGPRDDIDPGECLVSQLKYKAD